MKPQSRFVAQVLSASFLASISLSAADDVSVRKEIQAIYDRTLRGQNVAKTPAELDANEMLIDTPDWVSVVNNGPPQHWGDLRPGVVAILGHPQDLAIRIVKLSVSGDSATVIARVGAPKDVNGDGNRSSYALVRDTWIKTKTGWRRTKHEKPLTGTLDAELK